MIKKNILSKICPVVLAAGKGTRIREVNKNKTKVMLTLGARPMCSYILERLKKIGFTKPFIVIGHKSEQIKNYFNNSCNYILQTKRLGTGHAAKVILKNINNNYQSLMIFMGDDSAFYTEETLNKFILDFLKNKAVISFMVTTSNDKTVGRVVQDEKGNIVKVIEKEELIPEYYQKYKLVNTAGYLFDISWIRKNINKLEKHIPKGEYYLPDLIKIAIEQNEKVIGFKIPKNEWFGINTPEQYNLANKIFLTKK